MASTVGARSRVIPGVERGVGDEMGLGVGVADSALNVGT